eukprot:59426_1
MLRRLSTRSRTCNSNFFKLWSPTMSYWLGFLFADGCVSKTPTIYSVLLSLKCVDYSHVEKYKAALTSTYNLGLYKHVEGCIVVHNITDNVL